MLNKKQRKNARIGLTAIRQYNYTLLNRFSAGPK